MGTQPRIGKVPDIYAFNKAHRGQFDVQTMCRVLNVARGSANRIDYPIVRFSELPELKLEFVLRADLPWSSVREAGTVTAVAAVADAVFDAIGNHPRRVPLDPELIKSLVGANRDTERDPADNYA